MIDIETLLIHHPTLTVGEYFKMFPLPDTPVEKPKSELSKQLEVQVLTYQSAINEIEEVKVMPELKVIANYQNNEPTITKKHRKLRAVSTVAIPRSVFNFNKYAS